MSKKSICKLSFALLLLAVLTITTSSALASQRRPSLTSWCPAIACPTDLSGHLKIGQCQNNSETCEAWQNTSTRAYCSRKCFPF